MSSTSPTSVPAPAPRSFVERLIGALRLDAATYDEIEHDPSALGQAAGVIVLAALATAIGSAGQGGNAVGAVLGALLGWLVSTGLIWLVGVFWLNHSSDYRELLRTLGFASAPQIALVLGGIPGLGRLVSFAATLWALAAFVVAVRQALDVTTGRALLVCVLALLAQIACIVGLALLFVGLLGGGSDPAGVEIGLR